MILRKIYISKILSQINQPLLPNLKDAVDREDEGEDGQKIWVTKSTDNSTLYEFINKTMYRDDKPTRTYNLPLPFTVSIDYRIIPQANVE